MQDTTEIGRNLKRLIDARGTNASAVAKKAGLSHTAARDIIHGKSRNPTAHVLQQLASALGVSLVEITGARDSRRPGFSEPDIMPWRGSNDTTLTPEMVLRSFGQALHHPATFRAGRRVGALAIVRGDILVADLGASAQSGDTVLVTIANQETGAAETVVRRYDPPYVISGEPDDPRGVLRLDQTGTVALMGVVTAIVRDTVRGRRAE